MNIVAIGGGEKENAIKYALFVASNQNVLLIPSACSTETSYIKKVGLLVEYFQRFGIPDVQILHNFGEAPSAAQIEDMLSSNGLAYVIGGNTPYMLDTIKKHGTDTEIASAARNGMVLAGTSAGAILPFSHGQVNPATKPESQEWEFEYHEGLRLVDTTVGVHADKKDPTISGFREKTRGEYLEETFGDISDKALAIDEGAAVSITKNGLSVITSKAEARVRVMQKDKTPIVLGNEDTFGDIKAL
jgi:peptidase E